MVVDASGEGAIIVDVPAVDAGGGGRYAEGRVGNLIVSRSRRLEARITGDGIEWRGGDAGLGGWR